MSLLPTNTRILSNIGLKSMGFDAYQKAISSNNNFTDFPIYAVIQQINQADIDYPQGKNSKLLKSLS